MKLKSFLIPAAVSLSLLYFTVLSLLYLFSYVDFSLFITLITGGAIPFVNFILGFISIKISLRQTDSFFLIIFLGGMIFRLFLMLLSVFLALKFLEILAYSFIFIIFIFYSFYLISEIFYINQVKSR